MMCSINEQGEKKVEKPKDNPGLTKEEQEEYERMIELEYT